MSEHMPTPNLGLPWYADQDQREGYEWNVHVVEHNNPNMRVCFMANGPSSVERAAHLVKAVNSHVALVTELKLIADWRKVGLAGEYEHSLRDVIRSMLDCADRALETLKDLA